MVTEQKVVMPPEEEHIGREVVWGKRVGFRWNLNTCLPAWRTGLEIINKSQYIWIRAVVLGEEVNAFALHGANKIRYSVTYMVT